MALPNGRAVMADSLTPSTLSPKSFSPTNGVTSSTLDDASLDELDRIMDTLSTLSREASLARGPNDGKRYTLPSPPGSDNSGQRSRPTGSETTTPFSATSPRSITSPIGGFPVPASVPIPPPITSPPDTPAAQSPRHFSPHPKIMTMSGMPSQNMVGLDKARNPATVPRLPNNPYENTSILHGSHIVRPSMLSNENPNHPESPYVNKTPSTATQAQFFFGPLPISPQDVIPSDQYPPSVGPKPPSMMTHSLSDETNGRDRNFSHYRSSRDEVGSGGPRNTSFTRNNQQESNTLPAYNEKRSYLKNLEDGTLPRPRIDSARQGASTTPTPNLGRKLSKQQKPSLTEEAGEALNRLSLRRPKSKRQHGRLGPHNVSKTPSRHSTTSFNSFDIGRGYASVSTAPASTRGLIQHEVLPHRSKKAEESPLVTAESPDSGTADQEDESCCVRCGRFLYSHLLELFVLVAFCAGLPAGIVIQATGFHATAQFEKYYSFLGSTLLPSVLSTITPMLIVSSMLTGMGNLTPSVLKRLILLSTLFYILSTFAAVCIAIAFSFIIRPGTLIASNVTASSSGNVSHALASWPMDIDITLGNTFLRDDGKSSVAFTKDNLFYDASSNAGVADEIVKLMRFFFPGCGGPVIEDARAICNVFSLVLFSGLIGIGASVMGLEGGPIRHVLSQVGTVMSNMADVLLWYVPVGVFFYASEIVATRINWTSVGHDRQFANDDEGNVSEQLRVNSVMNDATQWFFVAVILSLGIYSLVIMPLVASLITFSNPFSLVGFRSVSPLLTAVTVGHSDLCIPVTLRCLIKGRGKSRCCKPQERADRRIARFSAVMGGIFHRAGSAIIITCSSVFLLQMQGVKASVGTVISICFTAMVTSVTSLGGRWFYGTDQFLKASVVCLSTAEISTPSEIPKNIFCFWLISRLAAYTDTVVDLLSAQIMHRACRAKMQDILEEKSTPKVERSTDTSRIDNRAREMAISRNKMAAARSTSGETSDYEEAPLLFGRSGADAGNESSSMNSRNDDSVFLPSRPQDARTNRLMTTGVSHLGQGNQSNTNGVTNPGITSRDEVSFVTF